MLTPDLPEILTFAQSGTSREAIAETTYTLTATDGNGDGNVNFADFLTFADKFGSPSMRHRSIKCSGAAERSLSSEARHLAINASGVIV